MVIRPVPARLHDHANVTAQPATPTDSTQTVDDVDASDDEMFLDADGELSSEVAIDTGLPIKRKNKTESVVTAQTQKHIVFKRKDPQDDTLSDYGKNSIFRNSKRFTMEYVLQHLWNRII